MFPNLVTYTIHPGKAGATLPPYDALAYQYTLAANGVFLQAKTHFWHVLMPLAGCQVRGLQPLWPHFQLNVPLLPAALLNDVLPDARHASRSEDNRQLNEALYWFHHPGHCRGQIRVTRPSQQATPTRVRHAGAAPADVILEMHSHGSLPAFWSPTDNQDEQGALLYGVIGRLDSDRPEIQLRLGVYGYHFPLPLTALFDDVSCLHDLYKESSHAPKT
jgi:PRTRC genetic system protein A